MTPRNIFCLLSLIIFTSIGWLSFFWLPALWSLTLFIPLFLLGIHDIFQKRHALLSIYPVIGHGRYFFEAIRPEIQQYFVEDNISGAPISREFRSIIYQRSKGALDTQPFGTQRDVYAAGYEWANHSLSPQKVSETQARVLIGSEACKKPYASSRLNISAMSFGSLSKTAILALNKGAKMGCFAHNTGEGGISPYHLKHGGDLIWQIGTGYFGCRSHEGGFDPVLFQEKSRHDSVKMIEIKLSQGAKPCHGGILPAAKVNQEIAEIRSVSMGQDVLSPPTHREFKTPLGLLGFVDKLRQLSSGKPIGFKLCIGKPSEFLGIVKAMIENKVYPDFITIDGAEGGTGAAPLEFTNSLGMPLREGLVFVHNALVGTGIRKNIRLIAAGKIFSAFHLFKMMALGADVCNSARAMMLALGCIQARRCHDNSCPTGVATQDPKRFRALDVASKAERVRRFQNETVTVFLDLVGAAGLSSPDQLGPQHVLHRLEEQKIKKFSEIYSFVKENAFLEKIPPSFEKSWQEASAKHF